MSTPRTIIALAIGANGITAAVTAIRNAQPRETTTILRPTPDPNAEQQAEGLLHSSPEAKFPTEIRRKT